MGLSYHYELGAPAGYAPDLLETFLLNVEGDARMMGFNPTVVRSGPFDTPERREFARRISRGLLVEDPRITRENFASDEIWQVGAGFCRVAPSFGVFLVVTNDRGEEAIFGFFRYPEKIRSHKGAVEISVPRSSDWHSSWSLRSPDIRYRSLVRRFGEQGFLTSEIDDFAARK